MLFTTTIFKTIAVNEMKPNFVRMKVSELKNYLQVGESVLRINVAKNFWILMSVELKLMNSASKSETSKRPDG